MGILIGYADHTLEKLCLVAKTARNKLPSVAPGLVQQRLAELAAFASLADIPAGAPLHFHALRENWTGHFAINIDKKYRIIFRPAGEFDVSAEGMPNLDTVKAITVASVEDYHG